MTPHDLYKYNMIIKKLQKILVEDFREVHNTILKYCCDIQEIYDFDEGDMRRTICNIIAECQYILFNALGKKLLPSMLETKNHSYDDYHLTRDARMILDTIGFPIEKQLGKMIQKTANRITKEILNNGSSIIKRARKDIIRTILYQFMSMITKLI